MMQSVFSQAWQISLVDERDSETRGEFHANIFKYYSFLLFLTASSIMVILKWLLANLVQSSYFISWQVTPFLLVSLSIPDSLVSMVSFILPRKRQKD